MVSLEFIYYLLPLFMGLYFLLPSRHRGRLISLTTIGLIAWGSPWGLIPFAISVFTAYLGGIFIFNFRGSKLLRRLFLWIAVVLDMGSFLLFARGNMLGVGSMIPHGGLFKGFVTWGVGIYTLISLGYCVDVYRGKCASENKFSVIFRMVGFFPALCVGPVLSLRNIRESLNAPVMSLENTARGIMRLLSGLFCKLTFSVAMYEMWEDVRSVSVSSLPAMTAWLGMVAFGLFVYFEIFSFSEIAAGIGLMMGIKLPENMRSPLSSRSFHEFFYRFNTSLYRWIRNCIYQGVRRLSKSYITQMIAALLCICAGVVWYTRSFRSIIFALFLLLALLTEDILGNWLKRLPRIVSRWMLIFFLLMMLPFMAFDDPTRAVYYVGAMLGMNTLAADMMSEYLLKSYILYLIPAVLSAAGLFRSIKRRLEQSGDFFHTIIQPIVCILLLVVCTAFMVSAQPELSRCMI